MSPCTREKRPMSRVVARGLIVLAAFAWASPLQAMMVRQIESVYGDGKGSPISLPEGVACNDSSDLVVADTGNGRLLRYTYENASIRGGAEVKLEEISVPTRVEMTSNGDVLVLDGRKRRIGRVSKEGKFLGFVEPAGIERAGSFSPRSFDLDSSDNMYVLDVSSWWRVQVIDPAGRPVGEIALPAGEAVFTDLTADSNGTVFVVDASGAQVYSAEAGAKGFSPLTERMTERMSFPREITTDEKGILYLVDTHGGSIVLLGMNGSFQGSGLAFGWSEGQTRYPHQLCVNSRGEAFLADTANSRVQVLEIIR